MKVLDSLYFYTDQGKALSNLRCKARAKRRLTYDCMNAIVQGSIVVCKKGHPLKSAGARTTTGIGLLTVLRGRSSSQCQQCKDYDEETTE